MAEPFWSPEEVDMGLDSEVYRKISGVPGYTETDEIMIHYTVTEQCPFHCRGCINALTAGTGDADRSTYRPRGRAGEDPERDIKGIADLIRRSGKERAVVVFYGGEPMLRLQRMKRVFRQLGQELGSGDGVRYAVITSGHFLAEAVERAPDLTRSLWLTALSVDGTVQQHDAMRKGTSLEEIRRQMKVFNRVRTGEVLVWSTMRPGMSLLDCFTSFMQFRDQGEAEHFFWHWDEGEGSIPDLESYLLGYRQDLKQIMESYAGFLERGHLLSIVHINDLLLYLFTRKRRGTTACAVERMANFDIIGDGKVHGCADLPEAMSIGQITASGEVLFRHDAEERLKRIAAYKWDLGCFSCGVEAYCGGRCPVQANTGGVDRARQYCFLMRDHVKTVKQYSGRIADAMVAQGITLEHLYRSAMLSRFSDVTP